MTSIDYVFSSPRHLTEREIYQTMTARERSIMWHHSFDQMEWP